MYHVNAGDLPGNDISRTFEGGSHGPSTVSFFLVHNEPGQGPELHHHPYDETFIILEGRYPFRARPGPRCAGHVEVKVKPSIVGPPGLQRRATRGRMPDAASSHASEEHEQNGPRP